MKLLIADDHTLFRDALVQYIERADPLSSVTLAKDFYQVIDILEGNPYQNLVVLDLRMPGMKHLEGLRVIRDKFPNLPVALMSGIAEDSDVREAIELGAVGYFPKTMSGKALLGAIQKVASGETYIPEGKKSGEFMPSYHCDDGVIDKDTVGSIGEQSMLDKAQFTPRERDVLSFLVNGASNKEIARALDLQIVTIKLHVRGICKKLKVSNRTQAALKAKEMGVEPSAIA